MAVIKREAAKHLVKDAVVLDLADIVQQCEVLKRSAQEEADRIVAEAQAERQRLISDASDEGRKSGFEQGLREGREAGEASGRQHVIAEHSEKLGQLEASWSAAFEEFVAKRDHLVIACKRDVLRLALSIAERVTHRKIECDTDIVCDQIEAALSHIAHRTRVVVLIHPDNEDVCRAALPSITSRLDAVEHAELRLDSGIQPGTCIIRTAGGGEIDATMSEQLNRIVDVILPGDDLASARFGPQGVNTEIDAETRSDLQEDAGTHTDTEDLAA